LPNPYGLQRLKKDLKDPIIGVVGLEVICCMMVEYYSGIVFFVFKAFVLLGIRTTLKKEVAMPSSPAIGRGQFMVDIDRKYSACTVKASRH